VADATDPKRTVKATVAHVFDADGGAPGGLDGHPPGTCQQTQKNRLMFTCPGCGQWGGVQAFHGEKKPEGWQIVAGELGDATTLTLSPSIHCISCCGWHGYLKNGVFESCP
jgi:hypothetical protein